MLARHGIRVQGTHTRRCSAGRQLAHLIQMSFSSMRLVYSGLSSTVQLRSPLCSSCSSAAPCAPQTADTRVKHGDNVATGTQAAEHDEDLRCFRHIGTHRL